MSNRNFDAAHVAVTSKRKKYIVDDNLEENVFKYYLMPSLQHASISKIAITLWYQADIKYQLVNFFSEFWWRYAAYDEFLEKISDEVVAKLSQITLPSRIRKLLSNIVPRIGKEIFVWIQYHDKLQFERFWYAPIAINCIDDFVWTPRGVIDYKETAKALLAKEKNLRYLFKYNIACAYCLEDDIAIIAPKVINTTFYDVLPNDTVYTQAMLYFWTTHIAGDSAKLNKAVYSHNDEYRTNFSTNEYLFKMLIHFDGPNQVAIKYIWDELSDEEKSRQIVPAIHLTRNTDVLCFLLSQMSKEHEKEVFKEGKASKILLRFLGDWLWGHYFLPAMHRIWDILSGYDYGVLLEGIVDKIEKTSEDIQKYNEYRAIFKEVWQWAPKHLKEYIFHIEKRWNGCEMFFRLCCDKNIDLIQSILFDLNDVQKMKILFSERGIHCYRSLITSNQWDLLEWLIESTVFSEEDVEFLKLIFQNEGLSMAVHFIRNQEWNQVTKFLKWAFVSDDDRREFKLKLANNTHICPDILKCIVANDDADFTELEFFFKWCASGNAEEVIELKTHMLEQEYNFHTVICRLIDAEKYELLEKTLNWCFDSDGKQITQFKQYAYQHDLMYQILHLIVHLMGKDNQLRLLEKFLYYWCSTDEEINKLKQRLLHPRNYVASTVLDLLSMNEFKLADELLIWCCNSSQIQIDEFKNRLMIDLRTENCLCDWVLNQGTGARYVDRFIGWFNPSMKTLIMFKEMIKNCSTLKRILRALDSYAQEQYNQDKAKKNCL